MRASFVARVTSRFPLHTEKARHGRPFAILERRSRMFCVCSVPVRSRQRPQGPMSGSAHPRVLSSSGERERAGPAL